MTIVTKDHEGYEMPDGIYPSITHYIIQEFVSQSILENRANSNSLNVAQRIARMITRATRHSCRIMEVTTVIKRREVSQRKGERHV